MIKQKDLETLKDFLYNCIQEHYLDNIELFDVIDFRMRLKCNGNVGNYIFLTIQMYIEGLLDIKLPQQSFGDYHEFDLSECLQDENTLKRFNHVVRYLDKENDYENFCSDVDKYSDKHKNISRGLCNYINKIFHEKIIGWYDPYYSEAALSKHIQSNAIKGIVEYNKLRYILNSMNFVDKDMILDFHIYKNRRKVCEIIKKKFGIEFLFPNRINYRKDSFMFTVPRDRINILEGLCLCMGSLE